MVVRRARAARERATRPLSLDRCAAPTGSPYPPTVRTHLCLDYNPPLSQRKDYSFGYEGSSQGSGRSVHAEHVGKDRRLTLARPSSQLTLQLPIRAVGDALRAKSSRPFRTMPGERSSPVKVGPFQHPTCSEALMLPPPPSSA
jgi:hypothetical protein